MTNEEERLLKEKCRDVWKLNSEQTSYYLYQYHRRRCGSGGCPELAGWCSSYCGECLELRRAHYSELVAGTAYIKVAKTKNGIEREVIRKQ